MQGGISSIWIDFDSRFNINLKYFLFLKQKVLYNTHLHNKVSWQRWLVVVSLFHSLPLTFNLSVLTALSYSVYQCIPTPTTYTHFIYNSSFARWMNTEGWPFLSPLLESLVTDIQVYTYRERVIMLINTSFRIYSKI